MEADFFDHSVDCEKLELFDFWRLQNQKTRKKRKLKISKKKKNLKKIFFPFQNYFKMILKRF